MLAAPVHKAPRTNTRCGTLPKIRRALLSDLDAIMRIECAAFETGIAESRETVRARIEGAQPDSSLAFGLRRPYLFVVAEVGDRIAGFAYCETIPASRIGDWRLMRTNPIAAVRTKADEQPRALNLFVAAVLPEFWARGCSASLFRFIADAWQVSNPDARIVSAVLLRPACNGVEPVIKALERVFRIEVLDHTNSYLIAGSKAIYGGNYLELFSLKE